MHIKTKYFATVCIINKPIKQSASNSLLLEATARGLDCAAGGFTIDPYEPTNIAVITHAHADHARRVANTFRQSPQASGSAAWQHTRQEQADMPNRAMA